MQAFRQNCFDWSETVLYDFKLVCSHPGFFQIIFFQFKTFQKQKKLSYPTKITTKQKNIETKSTISYSKGTKNWPEILKPYLDKKIVILSQQEFLKQFHNFLSYPVSYWDFQKFQSIQDYSEIVATLLITWNIIAITNKQYETLVLRLKWLLI